MTLDLKTLKRIVFTHIDYSVDNQIDRLNDRTLLYEIIDTPPIWQTSINLMTLGTVGKKSHSLRLKI